MRFRTFYIKRNEKFVRGNFDLLSVGDVFVVQGEKGRWGCLRHAHRGVVKVRCIGIK